MPRLHSPAPSPADSPHAPKHRPRYTNVTSTSSIQLSAIPTLYLDTASSSAASSFIHWKNKFQLYKGKLLQRDWWRKLVLMRVGRYIMTFPTHHYSAWHPESLCGMSRNQLTSTVNGQNPGSRPRWSMHTSWTTPQSDNRALLFLDNNGLSWTVFAPDKVTAVPVRINGNFQTPISVPAVRPKRCHTLSNPAHRQDYGGLSKLHSADDDAVAWLTSYGSWCIWQQQQLCCTRTANITQSSSNNLHSYVRSQSSLLRHFVFYAVLAGSLECFGFGLGFCVNVKTCCS